MLQGHLTDAVKNSNHARLIFDQIRLPRRISRCDNVIGGAYLRSLHPREAICHFQIAANWFDQQDLNVDLAWCKTNIGIAHSLLGNLALARKELCEAILLLQAANETHGIANCHTQLGMVCY